MEVTLETLAVHITNIENDVLECKQGIKDINTCVSAKYVTVKEFDGYKEMMAEKFRPIILLVYGLVALVLVAVFTALIYLVINRGGI